MKGMPNISDLIELYMEEDSFYVANIIAKYKDSILLIKVDEYGSEKSYLAVRTDDITLIRKDTRYISKIKAFMKQEQMDAKMNDTYKDFDSAFEFILFLANKSNLNIEIDTYSHDFSICGKPVSMKNGILKIEEINDNGVSDGIGYVDEEDIKAIFMMANG